MLTSDIITLSGLSDTLPTPGDPTYQTECLSLMLRKTLEALDTNSFGFERAESSDFTSYSNGMKDFIDDMNEREDEILLNGVSSIVATLPDVLPIIGAVLSGGTAAVPSILLNGLVSQLFRSRNSAITAKGGEILAGDADMTGIEEGLTALEMTLDEVRKGVRWIDGEEEKDLVTVTDEINQLTSSIHDELIEFRKGFVDLTDTENPVYFLNEFLKFALNDGDSILREVLNELTINLISQFGTQSLHYGVPPTDD